jgi:hypothetical protein
MRRELLLTRTVLFESGHSLLPLPVVGQPLNAGLGSSSARLFTIPQHVQGRRSGGLRGEGWVVAEAFESVREAVERAHSNWTAMPSLVDLVPQPAPLLLNALNTNRFTCTDTKNSVSTAFHAIEANVFSPLYLS